MGVGGGGAQGAFTYDVFISYSSKDEAWAIKLDAALTSGGLRVFRDSRSLEWDKPWEPALKRAIKESQHLVSIWTKNARDSVWAVREMERFDSLWEERGSDERAGKMFILVLEDEPNAYGSMQQILDLKKTDAYARGAAALDARADLTQIWDAVIHRLSRTIQANDSRVRVPVAFIALTNATVQSLEDRLKARTLHRWTELDRQMNSLGLASLDALKPTRGPARRDWRPFPGGMSIGVIVDQAVSSLGDFKPVEVDFTALTDDDKAALKKSEFSLILVDPLALYHDELREAFLRLLASCDNREETVIVTIAPVEAPPVFKSVSAWLKTAADPHFDSYYAPPLNAPSPSFGMNVYDEAEIGRMMRRRLSHHRRRLQTIPIHEYIKQ